MSDLLTHIKAENAKTQAWVDEDPTNRWAGMITEDLDHWAEYGVYTVEQYERYMLVANIWDLYKDIHGIRPRWMNLNDMSAEELRKTYDGLLNDLERHNQYEKEREARDIKEFEGLVSTVIETGAGDRETAIRWMRDIDEQAKHDDEYFEYLHHLPHGYLKRVV